MVGFRNGLVAAFVVGSGMLTGAAYAGCVGTVLNGECIGTYIDVPGMGVASDRPQEQGGYRSSTGTKYQYDNNNPIDRNRYSTDLDAQRRDQMNTDPRRDQDRNAGQYGGGIGWGRK